MGVQGRSGRDDRDGKKSAPSGECRRTCGDRRHEDPSGEQMHPDTNGITELVPPTSEHDGDEHDTGGATASGRRLRRRWWVGL